jgi:pullulanase
LIIVNAYLEDFNKIIINCKNINESEIGKIKIQNITLINIIHYTISYEKIEIYLSENINIKYQTFVKLDDKLVKASYYNFYDSSSFNSKFSYNGPLGAQYSKDYTDFFLYAPAASSCTLQLFESDFGPMEPFPMECENGVFKVKIEGDLNKHYYNYKVEVYGRLQEVYDPYSRSISINGDKGYIFSEEDVYTDKSFIKPLNKKDAVIYELNIRDISIDTNSSIKDKGRFLGLSEKDTSLNGMKTGLSHLKEMGINVIQIMPLFHLPKEKINEIDIKEKYNWGYDVDSFFALNGVYSNNPFSMIEKIKELKELISVLHSEGFYVTLDVVYNHTFYAPDSIYKKIFPGYYFRENESGELENGSGCSCDMASERYMVRRLIIDSLNYFLKEFDLDGFRFDLMGLLDMETMKGIEYTLKKNKSNILLYGEGWNIETRVPISERPIQQNADKLLCYSYFNDLIRDSIKGSVFSSGDKGFISGKNGMEHNIKIGTAGSINYDDIINGPYKNPLQSINYFAVHDNLTLWDKLNASNPNESTEDKKNMVKLAFSIILLSQGMPLIHSGEEFCRTKQGIFDSYNSNDEINKINWIRKKEFLDVFKYVKGLIELRKKHNSFKMETSEQIREHLHFLYTPAGSVGFILSNMKFMDSFNNVIVILNSNKNTIDVNIPYGKYNLVADKDIAGDEVISTFTSGSVFLPPISALVFYN